MATLKIIQSKFPGQAWEDVSAIRVNNNGTYINADQRRAMLADLKEYYASRDGLAYRIITRREKKLALI